MEALGVADFQIIGGCVRAFGTPPDHGPCPRHREGNNMNTRQTAAVTALLAAAVVPVANAVIINFDTDAFGNPIIARCGFSQTTALRDLYSSLGVTFAGAAPNDGGAILDECGSFGVPALSGDNFLAFNRNAQMQDGGIPTDPQIIIFDPAASVVSIWVSSTSLF